MFEIEKGKQEFFQWDLNRRLIINDSSVNQVHYCNKTDSCSLVTEVYEENGKRYSNVPNVLLQDNWNINVYAYDKDYTKHYAIYRVNARSKPADYAYTETEVMNWQTMHSKVDELIAEVEEAEKIRQDNELIRADNEIARTDAEVEREEQFSRLANETNELVEEFKGIKDQAEEDAKTLADIVVQGNQQINDFAEEAIGELEAVRTAIYEAGEAVNYANDAGGRANNATEAANEATQAAAIAAQNAVKATDATMKATEDTIVATTGANEAAERAENATQEAQEATTKANNAASGINEKFANALKGSKSGEALGITDISPVEHNMGVSVRGKNLLPFPYESKTQTKSGVTFTVNDDGTINVNGTATANITFVLKQNILLKKGSTYTISGCPSGGSTSKGYALYIQDMGYHPGKADTGKGAYFTTEYEDYYMWITVINGTVIDNLTFKPQLEEGATATNYAPYIEDISTVKLYKQGKNLLPYPYEIPSSTYKGVKVTISKEDGSILLNGTSTSTAVYNLNLHWNNVLTLPAGKYTIGGIVSKDYYLVLQNVTDGGYKYTQTQNIEVTFTKETQIRLCLQFVPNAVINNVLVKPFIVRGSDDGIWEPYIAPVIYDVPVDGVVEGVNSIYPSVSLYTKTPGAVIDTEYNRDINKAFAELQNALISLGGNV